MKIRDNTIIQVIKDLGIDGRRDGDEIWAHCPQHEKRTGKADRNPSWSINRNTGAHNCFSCGYKGSLHSLVRDLRGDEAVQQLAADIETGGRTAEIDTQSIRQRVTKNFLLPPRPTSFQDVAEHDLLAFSSTIPLRMQEERGFDNFTANHYEVLWDLADGSWIFPFRLPSGPLIGWQRKSARGRVFRNEPKHIIKSMTFFGWAVCKDLSMVVVVESPLDAVRLHFLGYSAIAVAGSKMSEEQEKLLSGFDRVLVALDNDTAGIQESKRLYRRLPNALFPEYPSNSYKDPGDLPKFMVHKMFGKYYHRY